jgi:hypothetical protein
VVSKAVNPHNDTERIRATGQRKVVVDLRAEGLTFTAIGKQLGISRQRAQQIFRTALARAEQWSVEGYREAQLLEIDRLKAELNKVIRAQHVAHSQGKPVRPQKWDEDKKRFVDDPDAQPYSDSGPKISAVNSFKGLLEREAKLTGADAPQRVETTSSVTVTINGVDPREIV